MVRGRSSAVTRAPGVYQCAETARIARGRGRSAAMRSQARVYSLRSSAFIGLPCPMKRTGSCAFACPVVASSSLEARDAAARQWIRPGSGQPSGGATVAHGPRTGGSAPSWRACRRASLLALRTPFRPRRSPFPAPRARSTPSRSPVPASARDPCCAPHCRRNRVPAHLEFEVLQVGGVELLLRVDQRRHHVAQLLVAALLQDLGVGLEAALVLA